MNKLLTTLLLIPIILTGQNKITCMYDSTTNKFNIPTNLELMSLGTPTITNNDKLIPMGELDVIEMDMVLLDLINDYRADNNLSPIKFSNRVWGVGFHHTTYMVRSGDLSHNESTDLNNFVELSFDERGGKLCDTVGKGSFSISAYENLARVYDTGDLWGVAEKILNMWISSPEHNSTLLTKTNKSSSLYGASVSHSNKKRGVEHTKNICIYTTLNIVNVLN